jgi:hypothetical protein
LFQEKEQMNDVPLHFNVIIIIITENSLTWFKQRHIIPAIEWVASTETRNGSAEHARLPQQQPIFK